MEDNDFFTAYFKALKKDVSTIREIAALGGNKSVQFDDIYIPLKLKEGKGTAVLGAEAALRDHPRQVVVGPTGMGKTILIKHLVLRYSRENSEEGNQHFIPIPLTAREYARSCLELRDYIDLVLKRFEFPGKKVPPDISPKEERWLILIDGLDEIISMEKRADILGKIARFAGSYLRCRIVITCRPFAYQDELKAFSRLELVEFDNKQKRELIENWFPLSHSQRAHRILKLMEDNKNIDTLAQNPLMLTIMVLLYASNHHLIPQPSVIFKRMAEVMLTGWEACKKIDAGFPPDQKEFILRKLSLRSHRLHRQTMTESEILEEIHRHASAISIPEEDHRVFLEEICQRNGLLRTISKDSYEFSHLAFQEYFTALELSGHVDRLTPIIPHLFTSWWENPILLFMGTSRNPAYLVQRIQQEVPEDIFFSNLMLRGKCIAEVDSFDPPLKDEIVRKIWNLYNNGEFQLLKKRAGSVLARLKPPAIIKQQVEQLTDSDPDNRRSALENLGLIGDIDILPSLFMVLEKDNDIKVRCGAAAAAARIGSPETVSPLMNVLKNGTDGEVRRSAAEALSLTGNTEALPLLVKVLNTDKDSRVRGTAAEALGKIGDPESIAALTRAFDVEKNSSVRWRIALALGRLGSIESRRLLIRVLVTDKNKEVRESAAEGLGRIGDPECLQPLLRSLSSDTEADVRGSAAYALGFCRFEDALPDLIKVLTDDNNIEVRGRAAYALGRIKNKEALPYLVAAFHAQKESMIRGNAAYALGEIGGTEAMPFLIHVLTRDSDPYVRYRAAEVLGSTGEMMAVPALKLALEDDGSYYGWRVKDRAFEALERLSNRLHIRINRERENSRS